ncbi:RNA polymerase sigma factor [Agrobacterium tumefaciens]|uniref:RNA polymerase sigma factor n=1 Tax=Agrobacterium tumefaciens TaxID=358 RepID=UPI0021CE5DA0|nr:sigma-70 family RNA polymerase sigma factor [Agrobacterium tumefaciens]UXS03435.1 sigma-70 family RNA polymerase sigma factor [Agrobacterium tumefaciens]
MSKALLQVFDAKEENRLMRFFRRRLGNRDDAADALQETLVRALEVSHATLIENPEAYLFQIAKSVAHVTVKRQSRERPLFAHPEAGLAVPCDQPDPERIVAGRQHLILMARSIEALPKRCQQVFVLSRLHGHSNGEIAARLDISRNMVEKHIIKALLHCRQVRAQIKM